MARIGIKDVARRAGVSPATVSLVLNGRTGTRITEATRDRVRQAASDLGYAPNSLARSLRTKRTRTIGLLSDQIATTPFAVAMVKAAHEAARERGYLLFQLETEDDRETERQALDLLQQQQVAGVVYAFMHHRVVDPPENLPPGTVFLDARPRAGGYAAVVPDDRGGARAATQELIDAGHRRIAFVDDDLQPVASHLRLAGYRDALSAAGIPFDATLHVRDEVSAAGGSSAAGALLDRPDGERPTAIFCFNDRMAMGAYRAVRHRGLQIARDVSIVGYDDQQYIAADLDPPLTTVALPHYEMGRWAMETLFAHLDGQERGEPGDPELMPCPLVRRQSVGPPPG